MPIISTVLSIYALYTLTVTVLVMRSQRRERFPMVVIAIGFPFLAVFAFVHVIFSGYEAESPCPPGLEEMEALVEVRRQRMFRSEKIEPSIAKAWKWRYAVSLELQARQLRDFSIQVREMLAVA